MTGGGSGGHITPILAVATELKQLQPNVQLIYIGQTGDSLSDVPAAHAAIDKVYTIRAGKFRRYHGEGWRQWLDLKTWFLNLRDAVYVLIGLVQSFWLLHRLKPNLIFIKGGFVGVPVGLTAALLGVPYITHDSDALPGLANRVIARWAQLHAVGQPKEVYSYPAAKTVTVGVPVQVDYQLVTPNLLKQYRQELGLTAYQQIICVAGGGLGAQRLNQALVTIAPQLLAEFPELAIIHQVGRKHERQAASDYAAVLSPSDRERVLIKGFVNDMYRLSGAADVIVSRAGATNMAEFAIQAKPCIIVPNPVLTGGHQLKNAEVLAKQNAIEVLSETDLVAQPSRLYELITALLRKPQRQQELADNLTKLAHPDAAKQLAELILDQAKTETASGSPNR